MRCKSVRCLAATMGFGIALALSGCADPTVSAAVKAIDAIGEVTVESREAIDTANEKYEAVDDELKPEVENADVLDAANDAYLEALKEETKKLFDEAQGLKLSAFAQFYGEEGIANLDKAIDDAGNALIDADISSLQNAHDVISDEVKTFKKFIDKQEDESLSRKTNKGDYPYAVEETDLQYAFVISPLVKRSSDYPYDISLFEGSTTDEPSTLHFQIGANGVCAHFFNLNSVPTTVIEVQDKEGNLHKALVNTELKLSESADNWGQDNGLYPLGEGSCYLYQDKDYGTTLAIKDLVGNKGYITYAWNY